MMKRGTGRIEEMKQRKTEKLPARAAGRRRKKKEERKEKQKKTKGQKSDLVKVQGCR